MRLNLRCCLYGLFFFSFLLPSAYANGWLKVESDHFIVYSNNNPDVTLKYDEQLEAFEKVADTLFSEIGDSYYPLNRKPEFYYLSDFSRVSIVSPFSKGDRFEPLLSCPENYPQFYTVNQYLNYKTYQDKYISPDLAILFRSYTATKISQYFSFRLPSWVRVGLMEYFMTTNITNTQVIMGFPPYSFESPTDPYIYSIDQLYDFDKIVSGDFRDVNDYNALRFQQWMMVHYFMTDAQNRAKLVNYLSLIRDGKDSLVAFKEATGMQPQAFLDMFRTIRSKGATYLTYARNDSPKSVKSNSLTGRYDRPLPLIRSALQVCPKMAYGKMLLKWAQDAVADNPSDHLSLITMARGEVRFGEAQKAIPVLQSLLTLDPRDQQAQYLLGLAYLVQAQSFATDAKTAEPLYARARSELTKAYDLNPTSEPILIALAKAYADQPGFPDDKTTNLLELAYSYGGFENGAYLAEIYVRRKQYDKALGILPKENNLGTSAEGKRMKKILDTLKSAGAPDFDPSIAITLLQQIQADESESGGG